MNEYINAQVFAAIIVTCALLLFAAIMVASEKIKKLKIEKRRLEDEKYKDQVMYDGRSLTALDKITNKWHRQIADLAFNTVKKSGRKLVTVKDMRDAAKQYTKTLRVH